MNLQVTPVVGSAALAKFIRFPYQIYAGDPHWVAPLEMERKDFFNPKKNPFYQFGEAQLFLAERDGRPVGRISAQVHRGHLERYRDEAGFFGFFESVDDAEVAQALLQTAAGWLRAREMKKMRGPYHFTINDEVGVLVDGFDAPPAILMNHNPAYYVRLLEGAGLLKVKDLFAYFYDIGAIPEPALQLDAVTRAHPGFSIRPLNMKNYDEEIRIMIRIFNEAWAQNWGFIPMTEIEIDHMAKQLRPIVDPEMAFFAFVGEAPAAMSICLPNVNEAILDLHGRLFPLGWAKLLWRLKVSRLKSLRLCLMGIRPPYRGSKVGALSVTMNVEAHRRALARGYKTAELSWTLEDNERINRGIEFMGGRRYKTYRVYEKEL